MMQNNLNTDSNNNSNKKLITIGITGGVGSGKSKVLSFLEEHYSCKVLQADIIANELKKPGKECYEKTIAVLGKDILDIDGRIDNKKMGAIIFSSEKLLNEINHVIHPAVKEEISRIIEMEEKKGEFDLIVVEAALLIEAGIANILNYNWFIYADDDIRRKRLKDNRNYSDLKINQIMSRQLSDSEFRNACDATIDNSGLWLETEKQIINKMEEYLWKKK